MVGTPYYMSPEALKVCLRTHLPWNLLHGPGIMTSVLLPDKAIRYWSFRPMQPGFPPKPLAADSGCLE
jgi:hypothetical protein